MMYPISIELYTMLYYLFQKFRYISDLAERVDSINSVLITWAARKRT